MAQIEAVSQFLPEGTKEYHEELQDIWSPFYSFILRSTKHQSGVLPTLL